MTADETTRDCGKDSAAESTEYEPEIESGNDCVRADCGTVDTAAPVGEIMAVPNTATYDVTAYRAEDVDEHHVDVSVRTDRTACAISLKSIFTPEEARDLARRLEVAADVAAGDRTGEPHHEGDGPE